MKKSRFIAVLALGAMPLLSSVAGAAPEAIATKMAAQAPVSIAVVGEVVKPGNYGFKFSEKPTLLSLIAASGGLTLNPARAHVEVRRGAQSFSINLQGLLKQKINDVDFALQDGDIVIVTAYRVFVGGAVKNPGYYLLSDGDSLSVAEALLLAGGPIEVEGNLIMRVDPTKKGQLLPLSKSDFKQLLQDGDSLYVLNPKVKTTPFSLFDKTVPPLFRSPAPRSYVVPSPQFKAPQFSGRFYLLTPNSAS